MGKLRKTLALGAFAGFVGPPIAAAIAKQRLVPVGDETADEIGLVTIFEGSRFTSRSTSFRGGSVLCWYGGLEIDLRGAELDPAGAVLRVRSLLGGTRIIVPASWQVEVRSTPIIGGVANETSGHGGPGPVLEIQALTVLGGIQVTTQVADEDQLIPPPGERSSGGDGTGAGDGRADILARAEAEAAAVVEAAVTKAKGRARGGAKTKKARAAADDEGAAPVNSEAATEAAADDVGPSGSNGS